MGEYKAEKENVDEDILTLGSGAHKVEIDLMQPLDPNKSPKVHIPALNHIGLWVDNLEKAVETLTAQGINFTPGGIRKGACKLWIFTCFLLMQSYLRIYVFFSLIAGYNVCFIHPKSAAGVLVELVQAPEDVIKANPAK